MTTILLLQKPIGSLFFDYFIQTIVDKVPSEDVVVFSNREPTGWWNDNYIFQRSVEVGLETYDTTSKYDCLNSLEQIVLSNRSARLFSLQFPWIIPPTILDVLSGNAFNLHLADIARYRGWNSFSHAILNGDEFYSWTLHKIESLVDTGHIYLKEQVPLAIHETAKNLYDVIINSVVSNFRNIFEVIMNEGIVDANLSASEVGQYYGRESLKNFLNITESNMPRVNLDIIARALHFPPFPPPILHSSDGFFPLLPRPVANCACAACEGLRLYK